LPKILINFLMTPKIRKPKFIMFCGFCLLNIFQI